METVGRMVLIPSRLYTGTFLAALSFLALEIALTRLLSVITWYNLAFFAVSTAMIGITAGSVRVYLRPDLFTAPRLLSDLANAALGYAISVPVSLLVLCQLSMLLEGGLSGAVNLLIGTAACTLPFYFCGVVIAAALTRSGAPIGRIYAFDLSGAAAGCLLALVGMHLIDTPSFLFLCGGVGALAATVYAGPRSPLGRRAMGWTLGLLLACAINSLSPFMIRPLYSKGQMAMPSEVVVERWNSFSRVLVFKPYEVSAQYWGKSPVAPERTVRQSTMLIDGAAGTTLTEWRTLDDLAYLEYDLTNLAYAIRPQGGACIIGVGGGRDVMSALWFGHRRIVGIDLNPTFIDLLRGPYRTAVPLADRPEVELVVDEARSYLARSREFFQVIQMSMIDTWAATGAGAYALSENGLYTLDGWHILLARLAPEGVLTVSRWYDESHLGETGRLVSLAVAALLQHGVREPAQHLVLAHIGRLATLLVSRAPFSATDIQVLETRMEALRFVPLLLPGHPSKQPLLEAMVAADSPTALRAAAADALLNYDPPTDDAPYFFNMLRIDRANEAWNAGAGSLRGNVIANVTLLALLFAMGILVVGAIVLPLLRRPPGAEKTARVDFHAAGYFCLIGAGFMLVEIALIQRMSLFLGHPVYALGVLLFTLILCTGIGSGISECLPLDRPPWVYLFPLGIAVAVIALRLAIPAVCAAMETAGLLPRIGACVALFAPLGVLLGFCYPTGMRLVQATRTAETPWYWALNGICGVFCSALAVAISIHAGIVVTLYCGTACYAALLLFLPAMRCAERPTAPQQGN